MILPMIGLVVLERNYLEVYPYDKWTGKTVPEFEEGDEFMPTVCEIKEGTTSRPSLLTEADLVGLMDKNGIGSFIPLLRPQVYSEDISKKVPMRQSLSTYRPSLTGSM